MDYKHLIPKASKRPPGPDFDSLPLKLNALQNNFSLPTLLLMGATFQIFLFLLPIPKLYTIGPAIGLLLFRIVDTILITYEIIPNPYLKGALPKRSTAQPMDLDGNFSGPGKQKIAIMLLGTKSNHPLGVFEPRFKTVGTFFRKMTDELNGSSTQESGFLGQTAVNRKDKNGATELVIISYWRSLSDIHRFAYGPSHLETLRWWNTNIKKVGHIGIMHEVFEADAGMWENVYFNFQPTLMGNTTYLKKEGKLVGGEVGEEWVSPLLDANRKELKTGNARRGLLDEEAVRKIVDEEY